MWLMKCWGRKRGKALPKMRTCKLTLAFKRHRHSRKKGLGGGNEFELAQVVVETLAGPQVASPELVQLKVRSSET